jgi:beta-lactam-binding protein with PASTA domain
MAAAHAGLGVLYTDLGQQEQAVQSYTRALQLRPAEPAAYYRLGLVLARDQPQRAAEYMRTYLDMEAPVFRQGVRVQQAQAVVRGEPPRSRTPDAGPTPRPSALATPAPTPSASARPPQQPVKVPNVVGDKREDAVRDLEKKGLPARVREAASCDREGRVLAQEPRKDERVPPGTTVLLTVASTGPSPVQVPKVEGTPLGRAEDALRSRRLRVGKVRKRQTNQEREGTVLDQEPAAGRLLAPECPVDLTVAEPEPLVQVPNFVGLSEQEALQRLPSGLAGAFSPLRRGEVQGRGTGGRVVRQDPKPGQMVSRGTAVDLVIEGGGDRAPDTRVQVPNLVNLGVRSAVQRLSELNLQARYGTRGEPTGCVTGQQPKAGAMVERGTAVYLEVGLCPIR